MVTTLFCPISWTRLLTSDNQPFAARVITKLFIALMKMFTTEKNFFSILAVPMLYAFQK